MLIPNHRIFQLILLLVVFIAVLIGAYVLVYRLTKGKNEGAVVHARRNYDLIRANHRKIKALIKAIESDTDESMYQLGGHDDKISNAQQAYDQFKDEFEAAKDNFENQTRPLIESEIRNNYLPQIESLEAQVNEKKAQHDHAKQLYDQAGALLNEHYASLIGKRYLKADTLTKLEEIISRGSALTIEDAIEVMKAEKAK